MTNAQISTRTQPIHEHDCFPAPDGSLCTFLGPWTENGTDGDLYTHVRSHGIEVIWRFGKHGDYLCRTFDTPQDAYRPGTPEVYAEAMLRHEFYDDDKPCDHQPWHMCACCHICGLPGGH